jgi:hypothetical protein
MQKYTIRHDKDKQKSGLRSDGKFALGIVLGLLGLIITFVIFEFAWGAWNPTQYLSIAPLIISLIVAMASTYFAANAFLEQRKAREAETDPVLIAHLGQREDARELVTFNISNVGAGAALNVQLIVNLPNDSAEDSEKRNFLTNIFRSRDPFAVILQGKSIEFNFALGWHLSGQEHGGSVDPTLPLKALPPFEAKLSYEDLAGGKYDSIFIIDVRELQGLGAHKSPSMRIVTALETIANRK